jgi:F0F1-type ATP synthase assembly protein I
LPFHRPIPSSKEPARPSSGLNAYVQAEKLMQIAVVLPASVVLCWGAGWWLDHHFHQSWIAIAGVIFGGVAGMVSVVRIALDAEKETDRACSRNGNGKGSEEKS